MAKGWVGTISPPGVLSYMEEESRGVWQTGNAVFMRNWPYAYALGNGDDSPIKGKFDVAPLPAGGGDNTLGGDARRLEPRGLEVLAQPGGGDRARACTWPRPSARRQFAIKASHLPTIQALYDDAEIAAAQPLIPRWKEIFLNAVPRPSAPTKVAYNEVSLEVLDRRCTRRCRAPAPPRRTSSSSSSTSTR